MSSESLILTKETTFASGLPLARINQPSYMDIDSYEEFVPTSNERISRNDTADYHTPLEDYDFAMSDFSSVLSEPPNEMNLDHQLDPNADFGSALGFDEPMSQSPPPYEESLGTNLWQRSPLAVPDMDDISSMLESDSDWAEEQSAYGDLFSDEDDYHMSQLDESGPLENFYLLKTDSAVSEFEKLPHEVLLRIACLLPSDSDLICLMLTCHTFARQLQPENSGVWKTRFLQKYDHPIVDGPYEFRSAYQLRAMALPRFGDLGFETRNNSRILLTILKDMVLETYNKPQPWHRNPRTSLNVTAFADAMKSDWMVHVLSTRFFARDHKHPFGRNPYNKLFDALQVVFSYLVLNRSAMAFRVGSDKTDYDLAKVYNWDRPFALLYERLPDKGPATPPPPPSSLFPDLRRDTPPKIKFKLDMNTLLHLRNFWHRHLTEARAMGGEETFVHTAVELAEVGIVPRAWTRPLQESSKLQDEWYGHYSCIYPWPKFRRQLEDKESEAEVWDTVDPLHLDISNNQPTTAWPQIFSCIPALTKTLTQAVASPSTTYLRGLAPFQPAGHIKSSISHPQHLLSPQHHHPYTSLRLRGLRHPINPQSGIPGWQRVVFVLYKPTLRYLNDVFDYATEYFGEAFEQMLSQLSVAMPDGVVMSYAEVQKHYAERLAGLLGDLKGPVRMSRETIQAVEDKYRDPASLTWGDVEHAYAYEGIMTPGGKVMMGRWWRIGPEGYSMGEGTEYNPVGRNGDRERGPFVFWATGA